MGVGGGEGYRFLPTCIYILGEIKSNPDPISDLKLLSSCLNSMSDQTAEIDTPFHIRQNRQHSPYFADRPSILKSVK